MADEVKKNEENKVTAASEDETLLKPADYTSPEALYDALVKEILKYHPSSDLIMIENAYKVAKEAHEGQLRKSGEPYIIHQL